jgi:hypothetical protein
MGNYTQSLFKNKKPKYRTSGEQKILDRRKPTNSLHSPERLVSCAIIRGGETHSYGFKSHADIRRKLGDQDYYASNSSDEEGFMTSHGRFVGRSEANIIGSETGQCVRMTRKFLSSDVDKW